MMQIVYFSKKDQLLADIKAHGQDRVFITPSPIKADNLRNLLSAEADQDVITISKFTGDLLGILFTEASMPQMKRKSELLLIFGILKNKYFPDLSYEQFIQAYNLFSDLRSYTLNTEALGLVLEEQTPDVKRAVLLFWKLLEVMGVVDEHGAYQALSEELRTHDEVPELKKVYIFWGFQHLNGQQIDLLKSLSIRYQVIIPFPLALRDEVKRSDWLSWLKDHKVEERSLDSITYSPKADWLPVNSRELSRYLKEKCSSGTQVILGVSKLSTNHIDIVPSVDVNFKVPHEILSSHIREVASEISKSSVTDLSEWLIIENKKLLTSGKEMSFKKLKVLQLYKEALVAVEEMTDDLPKLDIFFQKLLRDVVTLNQPRTSFIPTLKKNASIELKDLSSLEDIDINRQIILCVDDRFDDFQGMGQTYPESIQKALSSLGPIKRNELDLLFKQWELIDLFSNANILVLMPESVLKHSLVWKKVFTPISLHKITSDLSAASRIPLDYFKSLVKKEFKGNFSASKFQQYYDCPRKFYYNYVERISPTVTLERAIDDKISGTLVHRIIELYFKRGSPLKELRNIATEVLDEEILKSQLTIPQDIYSKNLLKFTHRATNGIELLLNLENTTNQKIQWEIEFEFENSDDYHVKGSMDCVGISDSHIYLLDFKSTDSSASANKDVVGMESLQLWVYALAAEKNIPEFKNRSIVFGYVVLDEPQKSNIFFTDTDLCKEVQSAKICSPVAWKESFPDALKEAAKKLEIIVSDIKNDKFFPARPRTKEACHYCELSSVCTKGEILDV